MTDIPTRSSSRIVCVVWAPYSDRMDHLARILGARPFYFNILFGLKTLALFRYTILSIRTLLQLVITRPAIVISQNPPIFCVFCCMVYCRVFRARLVLDHHSLWSKKTLGGSLGRVLHLIEEFTVPRGLSLVPHEVWVDGIRAMGGRVLLVGDFVHFSAKSLGGTFWLPSTYPVWGLAIHGGHPNECVEEEVEALRNLPEVGLAFCGPSNVQKRVRACRPSKNVHTLGFLPRGTYEMCKASADFGLCISRETLPHVLYEFISLRKPVIALHTPTVVSVFGSSLMYVQGTRPENIASAVRAIADPDTRKKYARRAAECYVRLLARHEIEESNLRREILRRQ